MASTYLQRTQGTPTSNDIGTISFWIKRGTLDKNNEYIIQNYVDANNYGYIRFKSDNQIQVYNVSLADEKRTNRLFRDTSAWYHVVLRVDTTQSTANDRVRLYINGIQETSFSTNTNGAQNANYDLFKSGGTLRIGYPSSGTATYFDGSMSHFHYCDGQSYAPTAFGETDANGVWKIKTEPSVTYGNEGYFILKDGNSVTDQSGNSNNWTVGGGTLTNTEDSPSNVFATGNPLYYYNGAYAAWSNGNNTCYTNSGATGVNRATLGASAGKYYWEVKIGASDGAGNSYQGVGVIGEPQTSSTDELGDRSWGYGYWGEDGTIRNNDSNIATYSTFTTNDIISVAMDLDNYKLYFAKNGTWQNSADPSAGTGGITLKANPTDGFYFPAWGDWDNNNRFYFYLNFGNGYFGTTAVSSAGTNASGNGIFEYDVPTGYTALSTKGLNL